MLLDDSRHVGAARRCEDAMLLHLAATGQLPSTVTADGAPAANSCCLTANCQVAIVWARLDAGPGGKNYRMGAVRALDLVMATQELDADDPRARIRGSHPVWGRYAPMWLSNWAANVTSRMFCLLNGRTLLMRTKRWLL